MIIAEYDKWVVQEFQITPEKLRYLWEQINAHKSLFSDLTRGNKELFEHILTSSDTFWMEILDEEKNMVGVMFLTELQLVTDAQVHVVFFDRKLSEKVYISRLVIEWLFAHFPIRRLTANIPSIYFATIRLAKKIGFKEEGRRRDAYLIGNRWVDEDILGITRPEVM